MIWTMKLSEMAQEALINVGTNRIGARISDLTQGRVAGELVKAELITANGGLTRRGSIVRERLFNALLDAAF